MKKILIVIICSIITVYINAQQASIEHYIYPVYKTFDNMVLDIMPTLIRDNYYTQLRNKDINCRNTYLLVDTTCKVKYLKIYTKTAKKGYLHVNQSIIDFIEQQHCVTVDIKITYLLNGKCLNNKEDVMFLIKLSKKKIKKIDYIYSQKDKSLTVNILTL